MGIGIKVFFVEEGDKLRRIPLKHFESLIDGNKNAKPLPEYAGQKVRYVFVIVGNENRKPSIIRKIQYFFLIFDEEGRMRRDEWDRQTRLSIETITGFYDTRQGSVVQANHIFARKQLEHEFMWLPLPELEKTIKAAVFSEKKVVKKHHLKLLKPPRNKE